MSLANKENIKQVLATTDPAQFGYEMDIVKAIIRELEQKLELFGLIEEHGLGIPRRLAGHTASVCHNNGPFEAPTLEEALLKFKESLDE